jgi:hypothetical protein
MAKRFFESVKHPGLWMNKHGVVFAPRAHEAAHSDLYLGVDWDSVPLRGGFLNLKDEIENEACEAGYRYQRLSNGDRLYLKPGKELVTT